MMWLEKDCLLVPLRFSLWPRMSSVSVISLLMFELNVFSVCMCLLNEAYFSKLTFLGPRVLQVTLGTSIHSGWLKQQKLIPSQFWKLEPYTSLLGSHSDHEHDARSPKVKCLV